jgi:hypothetical protein
MSDAGAGLMSMEIDDSDSVINEEGGRRRETLIKYVDNITRIYKLANPKGILAIRFMNRAKGKMNYVAESSEEYLNAHDYGGVTRIGTELKKKILDIFAIGQTNQRKPLLVLVVTDGTVQPFTFFPTAVPLIT